MLRSLVVTRPTLQARGPRAAAQLALTAGVLTSLLATADGAGARVATPRQVVKVLNHERAANGLYARLTVNSDWSAKCRLHDRYMRQNSVFGHEESPGAPGYTGGGAWAGSNAVLAQRATFLDGNPYERAPYHLLQLMHPALRSVGADESGGFGCVTTFPGFDTAPVAADAFSTWPGNRRRNAPWFEVADELPTVPGAGVGLPAGSVTGPNIMVYWQGPTADATFDPTTGGTVTPAMPTLDELRAATLTRPGGRNVDVRLVSASKDALTLPGSGFVIPPQPLRPKTAYVLTATFTPSPSACATACRSFTGTARFRTTDASFRKLVRVRAKRVTFQGTSAIAVLVRVDQPLPGLHSVRCSIGARRFTCPASYGESTLTLPVPRTSRKVPVTVRVPSFRVGSVRVRGGTVHLRVR